MPTTSPLPHGIRTASLALAATAALAVAPAASADSAGSDSSVTGTVRVTATITLTSSGASDADYRVSTTDTAGYAVSTVRHAASPQAVDVIVAAR